MRPRVAEIGPIAQKHQKCKNSHPIDSIVTNISFTPFSAPRGR